MDECDYQPECKWHRTELNENDPPRDTDWTGMDGELMIGRIRKEMPEPTNGKMALGGLVSEDL